MGKVVGEIVALQEHVSLILYSPEELGQGCVDMFRCFVLISRFVAVGDWEPHKVLVLGHQSSAAFSLILVEDWICIDPGSAFACDSNLT